MTEDQTAPDIIDGNFRWLQLVMGIVCMAMIANLQYGWTLFVDPIDAKYHWGRAAIQIAFTIFVLTETWLVPIEAWFVDRYGPRAVVMFGGVMIAIAWAINAYADSLALLYVGAIVGGIGAGSVYGTCVGNALKWFPDRRGLAAGFTAAGFGAGAALTVVPIAQMIAASRLSARISGFRPRPGRDRVRPGAVPAQADADNAGAQEEARIAADSLEYRAGADAAHTDRSGCCTHLRHGRRRRPDGRCADRARSPRTSRSPTCRSACSASMAALTFAISLDRIFDGFGRPFFGWVSDNIGRETTMFIAFWTAAAGALLLGIYGSNPLVFVLAVGAVLLRVRRDLQPVPGDLRRHVRREICHHQCRHALHREGHRFAAGAARERSRHGAGW